MFTILPLLIAFANALPLYMDYQVQEDYVPILGYHDIDDEWESSLIIKTENFGEQMKYLSQNMSCNFITMERLAYYIENQEKLPTNSCIINFDDGSTSQYHKGLYYLNKYEIPATFYIAIDNIDENQYYMTTKEIEQLNKMGHDMESHTLSHARLTSLTYEEQYEEIIGSKEEMEKRGYISKTFAYPYGQFNLETEAVLNTTDFVLARDIEQKNTWKDPRSPVISYNNLTYTDEESKKSYFNIKWHFWYIKPEVLSLEELEKKVGYTGWWQFEDNYLRIAGTKYDVKVSGSQQLVPDTDSSYAVLILDDKDDEIATQFITKYDGAFTIDMVICNATEDVPVYVYIDDVEYEVYAHKEDSEYSLKYGISSLYYYNFYINVPHLSPGVHKINVRNIYDYRIYLDKFRIFSNTSQDFSYKSYYKECVKGEDDYCGNLNEDWKYHFDSKRFVKNMKNSGILLGMTLGITCSLISCIYCYLNCQPKEEDEEEDEDIV